MYLSGISLIFKQIWRHKQLRMTTGLIIYSTVFLTFAYFVMENRLIQIGILMCVYFSLTTTLVSGFGEESSFADFISTIAPNQFMQTMYARILFNCIFVTIYYIICSLIFSSDFLLHTCLFITAVSLSLCIYVNTFHFLTDRIDFNNSKRQTDKSLLKNFIMWQPILSLLVLAIISFKELGERNTYLILFGCSLICILACPFAIRHSYKRFLKRKYLILSSFRGETITK